MGRTTTRGATRTLTRAVNTTGTVIRGTSGFMGFVWRHRIGLGPFLAGIAVLLSGLLSVWLIKTPLYVYGTYILGTALIIAAIRFGITDREGRQHARRDRVHLYIVALAALVWDIVFYQYVYVGSLSFKTSIIALGWMVGILGAPWWWNLRRRSRVSLENDLDAWPIVTRGTRLANTHWTGFKKTADGWSGFLNIPPQLSRREALDQAELIEGLTHSPTDSITVEPAGRNPNKVHVTCVQNDPYTQSIVWDGRSLRSITEAALLGMYSDRTEERTRWFEHGVGGYHRLIGGVARSGKSGLMHLLASLYGPCDDVVLWSIDLKGGTTLLPWAPLADWTATTIEEAMVMMQCAAEFVDARSAAVAKMGKQVAPISPQMPALIIMCDEIASLIGDSAPTAVSRRAGSAMVEIARKGTAMGVLMVLATQYPTLGALKDSQLKSQLAWRACFRLSEPGQGRFILPNMPKSVDPYRIPFDRRGTCYIDAQGQFRHTTLRVVYVRDEAIRPIVDEFWSTTPQLDKASLAWRNPALVEVYKKRVIWTPDMLDRMRAGEDVLGHTVEDLYDDVEDSNFDGKVDENDTDCRLGEPMRRAIDAWRSADPRRTLDSDAERQAWLAKRRQMDDDGPGDDTVDVDVDALATDVTVSTEGISRQIAEFAEHRMRLGDDDSEVIMPVDEWLATVSHTSRKLSKMLLFRTLYNAGDDGLRLSQLVKACNKREATLSRWLTVWVDHGLVDRADRGLYVMVNRAGVGTESN